MAPTHRGCALVSTTKHHHRQFLSADHLHHGLLGSLSRPSELFPRGFSSVPQAHRLISRRQPSTVRRAAHGPTPHRFCHPNPQTDNRSSEQLQLDPIVPEDFVLEPTTTDAYQAHTTLKPAARIGDRHGRYSSRLSQISSARARSLSMTISQCSAHSSICPNVAASGVDLLHDQGLALRASASFARRNVAASADENFCRSRIEVRFKHKCGARVAQFHVTMLRSVISASTDARARRKKRMNGDSLKRQGAFSQIATILVTLNGIERGVKKFSTILNCDS